jgi:hypothetical protein
VDFLSAKQATQMTKFQKGVSGNPKGRPIGSGKRQEAHKQAAYEKAVLARLQVGLAEIDAWHKDRSNLIEEYVLGKENFPLEK